MTELTIEKGIPVPPKSGNTNGKPWRRLAEKMDCGDSVVLSESNSSSLVYQLRKLGFNYAARTIKGTEHALMIDWPGIARPKRVWKLGPKPDLRLVSE